MSQKKQLTSKVPNTKDLNKVVYFKKEFKLMIHNITLEEEIRSTVYSLQAANYTSIPHAVFHITINSTVDITTIDMTSNEEEKADLEVTLDLSHFAKGIKNDLAIVKFQVAKEKVLAPSSVNFYTQPLANRKGTIEYKFVGQKVIQIDQQQFTRHNSRRDQIIQIQKELAENPQLKRLVQILDAKDQVIKTLQKKIASLIQQTRKLTHTIQRETSQQRKRLKQGLNLNLNVNASNNYHLKRLNQKLTEENTYLQKRLQTVEQQLQITEKQLIEYRCQNNILQIQIGKKSIIDLNPSRSIIDRQRFGLQKIHEQEYDEELERKSKMADSFFLPGDDSSIRSKVPTGRRPNHAMTTNPGTMAPGLTPRGNSKGRAKSYIDPPMMTQNPLQQQLHQFKTMDQEQVQLELNELKDLRENMENKLFQAVPQQDGAVRYPRLQAAIKSSYRVIERLNEQKNLLQDKLKRRDEQIDYLRRQVQKSKANFKNFEKQLRERSSNAKDQFEQRMAGIKLQTEMKMAEMRRQNRFSDYQSVMQVQKRQIEMERIRYENQALREKYEQAMNELRNLQLEKASQQNKYKTVEAAINKEKEMYKSKYYVMQDSFTKQEEELQVTKDKARLYEAHVARIQELVNVEENLKAKIEKEDKQIHELKNKLKRYQDKFTQIEPKWQLYRQMQHEFDLVKRKNDTLSKLNERFESRMEQLKKYASRLETAYYERKQKDQSDLAFDQHYTKQLQDKLEQTFRKLRAYQRQYYEEQMKELTQTKKEMIQFYYKRIVQENQRIDQNPTYTEADKQKFKNQKQREVNIVKEGKLDQIDKQYKKYESAFTKLVSTEEYLPKGLSQKVSYLEEKMRKFQIGEFGTGVLSNASQSILKNTVDRLNDSLRDKESQMTELKKTIGKMSDGGNLLKVSTTNADISHQRKSMIEEMQKSREIFTRSIDDLKRANHELLKHKSKLQIQVQEYKFKEQQLIFRSGEREKQLERMSKKNTQEFKRKILQLQKALEKKKDQNLQNKIKKEQFEQHTKELLAQVNANAALLQRMEGDMKNLDEENDQLRQMVEQYHKAEKALRDEVDNIKKQAEFNNAVFNALLQQRNAEFDKIRRIKDVQIDKLTKTIQEYEFRIETEVNEYLHTRRDLEQLQEKYNELEGNFQQTKVSLNVASQNYVKGEEDSVLKIHELEEANTMLENNLMELAQTLKQKEMELHESALKQQSLQKQLSAISSIRHQLTQHQAEFLTKQKHSQQIIEQQNYKLTQLQNKYIQISNKVHEVQRQNQTIGKKFIEKEDEVDELRDKLNKKYDEINEVKGLKFDAEIKLKQVVGDIEQYERQKQHDHQHIVQLQHQVHELRQQLEALQTEINQHQLRRSRLKPPPKTNLMSGSAVSDNDLGATRLGKSVRPVNVQKKASILSIKQIIETNQSQQSQGQYLNIDEAQSLRATHVNTPIDLLNIQENGPNRFRIWTVNQAVDEQRYPTARMRPMKSSQIKVDISDESDQDPNLQSDKSAREKQQLNSSQRVFRTMIRQQHQSAQQSQMIDQHIHQIQSYGSSQLIGQYVKEIKTLKEENQQLADDKHFLEEANHMLQEKINSLTGNVEESQRKSLLASAFGLTGGLFMRQEGQRSSVESNNESPHVAKIKINSGFNVAQSISSKQAIKIEDERPYHGSIAVSRKSSIQSPSRSPKLSPREKSQQARNPGSAINLARSSVGEMVSTRKQSLEQHIEQQHQRLTELQLQLEQVEQENKELKGALEEERVAVEKLMQEIQVIQEAEVEKHRLLEEKVREVQEITEYYEGVKDELEQKIENLVEEGIQKETEEVKLLKTFQAKNEQITTLVNKIQTLQRQLGSKSSDISKLINEKERSYREFRKYEQESQLQILRLKQEMTHLTELTHKKHSEVQLLAEDHFQITGKFNALEETLRNRSLQISKCNNKINQLTHSYNEAMEELKKTQEQKKSLRLQIHQFENDLMAYEATVMDTNKVTSLNIKKYQIRLRTSEQEKNLLKQKIQERQAALQSLKHTIALYNQQTDHLKQVNKELALELERTQHQLKDIMKSYEGEFAQVSMNLNVSNESVDKFKTLIAEKDDQIHKLTKTINNLQCDTRAAFNSQLQVKQAFQKYKSAKQSQTAHLLAQVQLKNDEYQKIKTQYQKESQEFIAKEQESHKKLSLSEESKKTFKEKLMKYQRLLEELERELEVMSQRPTKEHFDEVEFENELYKNRIEQLEQMLREFAPQAQHKPQNKSDQVIQLEFKRYKVQKQRQLQDISNQIDKYCLKINQLQQGNFMMKKQVEKLRQEMKALLEQNDALQEENYDLKEDMTELREQIEFYKGKRIENLSKLLNQTM